MLFASQATGFVIRIALVSAYLVGGLTKLFHFDAAIAEQAHFGLRPPEVWAVLAILVELGGSVLILLQRLVWLACGALGVLTAIAAVVSKPFWMMHGAARTAALNGMLEDLGLIAAFALMTWIVTLRDSVIDPPSR